MSAEARIEYPPGLSCGKLNRPSALVFTLRLAPFSVLTIVTVAPEIAAPDASDTDPSIALVVSPWPHAGQAAKRSQKAHVKIRVNLVMTKNVSMTG